MANLLYNPSNEALMTVPELMALPTPEKRGRFHQPYAFGDYVSNVFEALSHHHLTVAKSEFAVSHDGQRLFGLLALGSPVDPSWTVNLGVRGSHDQSVARGLTLGTQVMVCSNLCFHGDLGTFHTKQTTNILDRIQPLINDAVERIPAMAERQGEVFDAYQNTTLRPRHGDAALVEVYRRHGFTAPQLARAVDEWDHPSHEEHAEQERSVWQLFNAATEALKPTGQTVNMETVRQRSEVVSTFMNEVVGI